MNTVLNTKQIDKAVTSDLTTENLAEFKAVAKSQDAHTRLELAKAVREIKNPQQNAKTKLEISCKESFEICRKTILELINDK